MRPIKNTGKTNGTEIVQLYVSPKHSDSGLNSIQLKGFQRVELNAGEEKEISFKVSPQQLVQYKDKQWFVKPGNYEFKIGASCTDIRLSKSIEITGDKLFLDKGRQVFFSLNQ